MDELARLWDAPEQALYRTTMFTSLSGTTITFTIVLPAVAAITFSSASAASFTSSSLAPATRVILLRNFPFTWIAYSTSLSFASSASNVGHGCRSNAVPSPTVAHSSAAR